MSGRGECVRLVKNRGSIDFKVDTQGGDLYFYCSG